MKTEIAKYIKKTKFTFDDLVNIMKVLRGDGGCPWDKEQDHMTIRKNLIEEAYEVAEAIDNSDDSALCEELGDLLLQVVFHAEIADDEGAFSLDEVCTGICKKLILRHPHIFSDVTAIDSDEVIKNWDAIKKIEKNQKSTAETLASVPRQLPALMRADKLQKKAAKVGFDWQDASGAFEKLQEEIGEVKEARCGGSVDELRGELGDLLFSAVNISRKYGIDPEEALTVASDKFQRRFTEMEQLAKDDGCHFEGLSLSQMEVLWDRVKTNE